MFGTRTTVAVGAAALIGAGVLAGCSSSNDTATDDASASAEQGAPASYEPATTVNGEVPPGIPTTMVSEVLLLDVTEAGTATTIRRGTRAAGTRSPIHYHPSGGSTCVEQGEMTLFLEGAEPLTAGPGECYWMPAGRPMTGYNSGTVDAVFIDSFTYGEGTEFFVAVEDVQPIPGESAGMG